MKTLCLSFLAFSATHTKVTDAWAPALSILPSSLKQPSSPSHSGRYYNQLKATKEDASQTFDSNVEESDKTADAFLDTSAKILGQPIPYDQLTLGVLSETFPGENRVSQTPDSVRSLVKAGMTVIVQSGGTYFCILV